MSMNLDRTQLDRLVIAAGQKHTEQNYWLNRFSGEFSKTDFPYDMKTTGFPGELREEVRFKLTGETHRRLLELVDNSDIRLLIVLAASITVLLHKYTGDTDITLGIPIFKQEEKADFINTVLPLRNQVEDDSGLTFKAFLLRVGQGLSEAVKHQNYPIEALLSQLNIPYQPGDFFPLFDTVVLLRNLQNEEYLRHIKTAAVFSFSRQPEEITGTVHYCTSRYEKETIERIVSHFIVLVEKIVGCPEVRIADIDILLEKERHRLLFEFNHTEIIFPMYPTAIHRLFEKQAGKTPDNIAVEGRQETGMGDASPSLTYRELNEQSNKLSHFLKARGLSPCAIAAIMAERSLWMIRGILGILKTGAAYLPIAHDLPAARKRFMLADSNASLLVIQEHLTVDNKELIDTLAPGNVLSFDNPAIFAGESDKNSDTPVDPKEPAYIIYTSGSTGLPKGVVMEHKGIANYIIWAATRYVKETTVNFPLYTSFAFDLTVTSIFTPLITGNTIIIYSGDDREFLIKKVIEENRTHFIKLTPAHLQLIRNLLFESSNSVQGGKDTRIKRFVLGGENLPTRLAKEISDIYNGGVEIYNEYGPTETAVGSMIYRFSPELDRGESVPIGVPIANTHIYVLDKRRNPVPVGAAGEMFISGAGVARGYLNRPELTAEKFLDNPFLHGTRMYASGDLARHCANGCIEFLGRKDRQVKIRGFRVELEEIENKIKSFNKHVLTGTAAQTQRPGIDPNTGNRENKVHCKRCLIPIDFPDIRFDEQGICNICHEYEKYREHVDRYFKNEDGFARLVEESRKNSVEGAYDCLLMFSGGKDSSYVLYRLIEMGLKVLTFTFDNGYISQSAFENIKKITTALHVDHHLEKAEYMKEVFLESLTVNHNVCQGCWHALNTYAIKIAHEKRIPMVVSGLSRGQIFDMRLEGLFRAGIFSEDEIEEKLLLFRKTYHSKDSWFSRILKVALDEEVLENLQFVDFFRYYSTPTRQIEEYLEEKGWVRPSDTGFCSSNCLINDVGIYVYMQNRGQHYYAAPLSWDVRMGQLPREQGLKEIEFNYNPDQVEGILRELGYYDRSFIKDAVVLDQVDKADKVDKVDSEGNKYICAYIVPGKNGQMIVPQLQKYLATQLPAYMIPSHFYLVEKIPLSPIGKVDKQALAKTAVISQGFTDIYIEPQSEEEKIMADLCKDIFKLDRIGINDNFFNLGATSFNIIQLSSRMEETFKKEIQVVLFFEYPTIASFLAHMNLGDRGETASSREHDTWVTSKKKGQDTFRKLKNKKLKEDE